MKFPQEIWGLIMGHFHSSYKRPPHYTAMMMVNDFYFTRLHHRENHKYNMSWNRSLMVDTYYMRVIISNNNNTTRMNLCTPRMKRGVATGITAQEFREIFDAYKRRCVGNYLYNLEY